MLQDATIRDLRELAAVSAKNKHLLGRDFLLNEVVPAINKHYGKNQNPLGIYAVRTAPVKVILNLKCEGQGFQIIIDELPKKGFGTVAAYVNKKLGVEVLDDYAVSSFDNIYEHGDQPVLTISFEHELEEDKYQELADKGLLSSQPAPKQKQSQKYDALALEQYQDGLTRKLSAEELAAAPSVNPDEAKLYFWTALSNIWERDAISYDNLMHFVSGVLAKSVIAPLPAYSGLSHYNMPLQKEYAFGAFVVARAEKDKKNYWIGQVRKDGWLGNFGGYGRMDYSFYERGRLLISEPEQPLQTVIREILEEGDEVGKTIIAQPMKPVFASVYERNNESHRPWHMPDEVAFAYEAVVAGKALEDVEANLRKAHVSKKIRKEITEKSNDEVDSFLMLPLSVAAYCHTHFRFPHEGVSVRKANEENPDHRLKRFLPITRETLNLLAEIRSTQKGIFWDVVAHRMAMDAAYDAILFPGKETAEEVFVCALNKYASAVAAYLEPAKHDVNKQLIAIYELQNFLQHKLPQKLADEFGLSHITRKGSILSRISQTESTDVLECNIPVEDVIEKYGLLKRAFGIRDIKVLTTEIVEAEKQVLHQSFISVAKLVGVKGVVESERKEQTILAEAVAEAIRPAFMAVLPSLKNKVSADRNEIDNFVARLFEGNTVIAANKWQQDAVEYKAIIEKRIAEGLFSTDGEEFTAAQLVAEWVGDKHEHLIYQAELKKLADNHIKENYADRILKASTGKRKTIMKTGGIAAGKTELLKIMAAEGHFDETACVMMDADYVKRAVAIGSYNSGIISESLDAEGNNWGVRVHNTSSNINYELTLQLHEMAKKGECPDVVICMMAPNRFEVDMALENNGSLEVEMLTTSIDEALQDAKKRALGDAVNGRKAPNRLPPEDTTRSSHKYSNCGMLYLAQYYKGRDIKVSLRERVGSNVQNIVANFDVENSHLTVNDLEAFTRHAGRAFQSGHNGTDLVSYLKDCLGKGLTVSFKEKNSTRTLASLTPEKVLNVSANEENLHELTDLKNKLCCVYEEITVGGFSVSKASFSRKL